MGDHRSSLREYSRLFALLCVIALCGLALFLRDRGGVFVDQVSSISRSRAPVDRYLQQVPAVEAWSVDEVLNWLQQNKLEYWTKIFKQCEEDGFGIDGATLLTLDVPTLQADFGETMAIARKQLIAKIASLKNGGPTSAPKAVKTAPSTPPQARKIHHDEPNAKVLPTVSVARIMFNTWEGDTDKSEVQCQRHPNAAFCTDDAKLFDRSRNGSFACEVLKTPFRYDYDHMTYKKLQCLHMLRDKYPTQAIDVLQVDTDQTVHVNTSHNLAILSNRSHPEVYCTRRNVSIIYNPGKEHAYHVWRRDIPELKSPFPCCVGALIFTPVEVIDHMFKNLAFLEHYQPDDVAFSWFFMRMNYTMKAIQKAPTAHFKKDTPVKIDVRQLLQNYEKLDRELSH